MVQLQAITGAPTTNRAKRQYGAEQIRQLRGSINPTSAGSCCQCQVGPPGPPGPPGRDGRPGFGNLFVSEKKRKY